MGEMEGEVPVLPSLYRHHSHIHDFTGLAKFLTEKTSSHWPCSIEILCMNSS